MPVAHIDRLDTLSLVERLGVIRSLTRKARVVFSPGDNRPVDFSILSQAMAVIEQPPNLLLPFAKLSEEGYDALVLVERSPSVVSDDPGVVDITLKYEHILDGAHQQLFNPYSGLLFGKGKCSITEKTTNFYRANGDPNASRIQILVGHTFDPEKDPSAIPQCQYGPILPFTSIQGGEITIPFPAANFQLQGIVETDNPLDIADQFVAKINSDTWLNKPALTWICSEVQWEVLNPNLNLSVDIRTYRFSFEFQYNVDTWDPTVAFNDQRTGRPPAGVKKADLIDFFIPQFFGGYTNFYIFDNGVESLTINQHEPHLPQPAGYWTVPALERINFPGLFQALFEGSSGPVFG